MCFGGSSAKTDRGYNLSAFNTLKGASTGLTAAGAEDTGAASKYFGSLLSGNPATVDKAIAPETAAINKGTDAAKRQLSTLGTGRTGGTNAITQNLNTAARGQVADVTNKARSGAAEGEARIGAGESGTGVNAASNLASESISSRALSQKIHDEAVRNWSKLILGVATGTGALEATSTWGS